MKTRSLKELFEVMLANKELFVKEDCNGLCTFINLLCYKDIITYDEYDKLEDYIENNRPKRGRHYDKTRKGKAWYWSVSYWPPREAWIKDQIKKRK